jgi:hypothetical protein
MTMLDRRLHAFRADLAERRLQGQVEALRFVDGTPARVAVPVVGLRPKPDLATGIDTELLLGEDVTVFDRADGWCWVKAASDGYVGYLEERALSESEAEPTHIVTVQRTFLYREPELRKPYKSILSMGSRIRIVGEARRAATTMRCWRTGRRSSPSTSSRSERATVETMSISLCASSRRPISGAAARGSGSTAPGSSSFRC